jgi:hypothetical protein
MHAQVPFGRTHPADHACIALDIQYECSCRAGLDQFPSPKRVQILTLLCEGMSLHAISRRVDMSAKRVAKLLVDAGRRAPSSTPRRFTV